MTAVTVGAHRSFGVAMRDGARVNALLIRHEGSIADSSAVHYRAAAVTRAASLREIRTIDCRLWIAGREYGGHIAANRMAVETACRIPAVLNGSRVKAVIVSLMCIRVELRPTQERQSFACPVTPRAIKRRAAGFGGRLRCVCPIRYLSSRGKWQRAFGQRIGLRLNAARALELTNDTKGKESYNRDRHIAFHNAHILYGAA